MSLPPLPELPFLPERQEDRALLVRWATEYGMRVARDAVAVCHDMGPAGVFKYGKAWMDACNACAWTIENRLSEHSVPTDGGQSNG